MEQDPLYNRLSNAATNFMKHMQPKTPGSNEADPSAILSDFAPSARIQWGHSLFVSTAPPLQGEKSPQEFVDHIANMSETFDTWDIAVSDINVDARRHSAVVRADFDMSPKGKDTVRNEILFWLVMDEDTDKVVKCVEFIDPVAMGQIKK